MGKNDLTNRRREPTIDDRDLYSGLIRLHVLHHTEQGPIFGLGMIEELARHGYRISPGTLYPFLRGLEKKGYLKLGLRGGSFTEATPTSASMLRNSPVNNGSRSWMR